MITILHLEMRGQLDDLRRWLQQRAKADYGISTIEDAFEVAILLYFGGARINPIGKGLHRWAWAEFKRAWKAEDANATKRL